MMCLGCDALGAAKRREIEEACGVRIAVVAGGGSGALGAGETGEGSAAPEPQRHGPLAAHVHAAVASCSGEQWWRVQPQLSLSEVAVSFDLDTRGPSGPNPPAPRSAQQRTLNVTLRVGGITPRYHCAKRI